MSNLGLWQFVEPELERLTSTGEGQELVMFGPHVAMLNKADGGG